MPKRRICHLEDCDNPVQGRKRYCSAECRLEAGRESDRRYEMYNREARNQAARDRRAADGDRQVERTDEGVVDYSTPATTSKPPEFSIHRPAPRRSPGPAEVDDRYMYGGGTYQGPQPQKIDETGIPASMRHNRELSLRTAASRNRAGERELLGDSPESWSMSLQQIQDIFDGRSKTVEFLPTPQVQPPRYDLLGRPYRRNRGGLR